MKCEISYLAGLFDGEGCIDVTVDHPHKPRRGKNPIYAARLVVANTDPRLIQAFQNHFGFGDTQKRHYYPGTRPTWNWRAQYLRAVSALMEMYPYLLSKREEARYAVLLHTIKSMRRYRENPPELLELYAKIKTKIKELHHREFEKDPD